ncbi:MAG TPA: hypothetical protein PLO78_05115 [Candidatus Omnitrophota bacterium]|nr:hypothetical protein [Candidatus Omnitrophota bacterium]
MLAEMEEPQGSIPYLDKASNNVHFEHRVFPFTSFYFINETTTLLLNILERNALRFQMPKETISSLLLGQNEFLGQSLSGMPVDVLMHWVYASISIKCYVLSQDEEERLNARQRLLNLRETLYLDELFGKRKEFRGQTRTDSVSDSETLK